MSNSDSVSAVRSRAPVPLDECGLAYAATMLGDRWTLLILREAFYGVRRFDDLQADLAAPRQALADRLAKLVSAGLLTRQPYQERGQRRRYEYHLTDKAVALVPALIGLMNWGEGVGGMRPPIALVRKDNGLRIRSALVDQSDAIVPLDQVAIELMPKADP
jgi:DNA-binding HxlR family transcriptional regulator